MAQVYDMDDFPPGSVVQTPSGRVGIVIKHQNAASKRDHFQRLQVHFGGGPRDSVLLQPDVLRPIQACTVASRPQIDALLEKLRERHRLDPAERALLQEVLHARRTHECPAGSPVQHNMNIWTHLHQFNPHTPSDGGPTK